MDCTTTEAMPLQPQRHSHQAVKKAQNPRAFDLEALLQEVATVFNAAAHARPVKVVFDIDTMLPRYLLGDAASLKQVLFSLGDNAIRSTLQGELTVAVEVEQMTACSASLIFSLRDSRPDNLLQEPADGMDLCGADAAITQRFAGSAQDMAHCQRLVERLGGELELMSPADAAGHFQLALSLRRDRSQPTQVSVAADIVSTEFPWTHVSSVKKV